MPPTLHPYLKRGLDFDASPIDPSDLVEDPPRECPDARYQVAKRRRVEAIALQYLRGRPPVILTASLKGPLTKEWKNPWAKDVKGRPDAKHKATREQVEEQAKTKSKTPQIASPETSRAVVGHAEEHVYSQPELELSSATAPLPDEDDLSGATEFFSAETEQSVANNSPVNPFWLRRPTASITLPTNSQTDRSPTRLRKKQHTLGAPKKLRLAPPRDLLGGRSLPIRATPPYAYRSSASAPMDISSPANPATTVEHCTPERHPSQTTPSVTDVLDSVQKEAAHRSQVAQNAQIAVNTETPISPLRNSTITSPQASPTQPLSAQSFDSLVPATTYKTSNTVQVPRSSPMRGVAGVESQARTSRGGVQRPAERLVSMTPGSSTKHQPLSATCKTAKEVSLPKKSRHNLVASPAPVSSTGFMYRRVGQPKNEGNDASKEKPRAVDFNSSPIHEKDDGPPDKSPRTLASVVGAEVLDRVELDAVAEDAGGSSIRECEEAAMNQKEDQHREEQQESYRSRQSQYSTQAAMLLAQLEFQEDSSQSSTSSATLRPWSQPAHNTPPPLLQPSPAITPLSVFNNRMDNSFSGLAGESILHGPPISTQDLFDAASPFAFSTVKKSERPRRTSLRFALTSRTTESMTAKSPTPSAERVPLKEKNAPTMWSFTHEKPSLCSPEFTSHSPKRTTHDVELPQLDFHTTLDDVGLDAGVHLTDYFLRSLEA